MNSILLDTNLLIYAIDEDSKYYNSVQKILDDESNNLFTTSKNISVPAIRTKVFLLKTPLL